MLKSRYQNDLDFQSHSTPKSHANYWQKQLRTFYAVDYTPAIVALILRHPAFEHHPEKGYSALIVTLQKLIKNDYKICINQFKMLTMNCPQIYSVMQAKMSAQRTLYPF